MTYRVFTCSTFDGVMPTGTAATVCAVSREEAARLLAEELEKIGLGQNIDPQEMNEVDPRRPVRILQDGDY